MRPHTAAHFTPRLQKPFYILSQLQKKLHSKKLKDDGEEEISEHEAFCQTADRKVGREWSGMAHRKWSRPDSNPSSCSGNSVSPLSQVRYSRTINSESDSKGEDEPDCWSAPKQAHKQALKYYVTKLWKWDMKFDLKMKFILIRSCYDLNGVLDPVSKKEELQYVCFFISE